MQVICWELLTERHFYSMMMAPSDVIDALNGDKQLPSELPLDEAVATYVYTRQLSCCRSIATYRAAIC